MEEAYYYYNKSLESNCRTVCYYAYYNLAKYFNKNGTDKVEKDINKYKNYLETAARNGIILASIELFYYYCEEYFNTKEKELLNKIDFYKDTIENSKEYNDDLRIDIENKLKEIVKKKEIDISCIV